MCSRAFGSAGILACALPRVAHFCALRKSGAFSDTLLFRRTATLGAIIVCDAVSTPTHSCMCALRDWSAGHTNRSLALKNRGRPTPRLRTGADPCEYLWWHRHSFLPARQCAVHHAVKQRTSQSGVPPNRHQWRRHSCLRALRPYGPRARQSPDWLSGIAATHLVARAFLPVRLCKPSAAKFRSHYPRQAYQG